MQIANASPNPSATARHERLTRYAEQLVAQSFFGTLLKQMRDSPFRSELFDGGRGGQTFGALLDQRLAERMSRGAAAPLVRSIVRQIEGKSAESGG
jgi:Rod binding domain-containing protein